MDDLKGRVAVVTGGGSGVGRGLALRLAAEERTVAVADIQTASAEAVAAEVRPSAPEVQNHWFTGVSSGSSLIGYFGAKR